MKDNSPVKEVKHRVQRVKGNNIFVDVILFYILTHYTLRTRGFRTVSNMILQQETKAAKFSPSITYSKQ